MEQENLNEQTPLNGAMENETQDSVVENVNNEVSESVNDNSEELSGVEQENQVGEDDYSKYELQDLLAKLNQLINNHPVETIINAVEEIKSAFYKQYRNNYQEAREKYIEQGGAQENFKFADEHQEVTFKELYSQFRDKKSAYNQQLAAEREANQNKRLEIIEKIKNLINNEESINKTFQEFHDLQQQWREIGQAAPNDMKKLWDSYNHVVEQFYDYVKINRELRDLDLKENLKAKTELCEKAEALTLEDSVVEAFRSLQALHDKWREIGPVPNDQKEEIWDRFKAATTIINKKHQDFFEKQKDMQVQNLAQKTALCEQIEELINSNPEKPKEWDEKSEQILKIQELWRTIGYAPKKENSKIYQRFKNGCDLFFAKKREFYRGIKAEQKSNLQLKMGLCEKAEALKDSTDWKATTDAFISLQKRWKEIGQTSHKQSEQLWARFRTACDYFFKAKAAHFSSVDESEESNLNLKQELIEKVKNFEKGDNDKENLHRLMELQKEWGSIGHVPLSKKDAVQKAFREAIDAQFASMKLDASEREKANFKNKIESWSNPQSRGKLYSERNKIINKMRELENEITLYENNIGFFSKSANSENLIRDINRKIERAKGHLAELRDKLRMLDEID